jgi:Ala-tRNA(Pro) deacylase
LATLRKKIPAALRKNFWSLHVVETSLEWFLYFRGIDFALIITKIKWELLSIGPKEEVMPILTKLKETLDAAKVSYEIFNHPLAYTAQEIAAKQHVPGNEIAKVVMLEVDGTLVMGVIAGSHKICLGTARASLGARQVRLATEDEFVARFPGCEIGAMPPFGNLFDLSVIVDPALERDQYIYFNAGNHAQTVRLAYKDFAALVKPRIARLVEALRKKAA